MKIDVYKISEYISAIEATQSQTASKYRISNAPTFEHLLNMVNLGRKFFDPIRRHFGIPIRVNSFYRSEALNKKIGGASRSWHLSGQAIDISSTKIGNEVLFHYIRKNMRFHTLIAEFPVNGIPRWCHITYCMDDSLNNKKNVIIAVKKNGRTTYVPYEQNKHLIKN